MAEKKDKKKKEIKFELKPNKNVNKPSRRVGRGKGSNWGKTCAKGQNGQKSRKGKKRPYVGFEGGQMPLNRRLPKRGFNNEKFAKVTVEIKTGDLNIFKDGAEVNIDILKEKKLIPNIAERVKIILGSEELKKKLKISVYNASKGAQDAVKKSGSELILDNVKADKKTESKKSKAKDKKTESKDKKSEKTKE